MSAPFIIFALPRSRTYWLSRLLHVTHDLAIFSDSIDQFIHPLKTGELIGTVETGAMAGWRVIRKELPSAKFVVIKRPVDEIYNSLWSQNIYPTFGELEAKEKILNEIVYLDGTETIEFRDLAIPSVVKWLYHHCLGIELSNNLLNEYQGQNLQLDLQSRMEILQNRSGAITRLKQEIADYVHG